VQWATHGRIELDDAAVRSGLRDGCGEKRGRVMDLSYLAQLPVGEGSCSLLRCLPEGEGASSTWDPRGAGWSWLIPMQPLRKKLEKTTNGSSLVMVIESKRASVS
jgi:hypothetical protein